MRAVTNRATSPKPELWRGHEGGRRTPGVEQGDAVPPAGRASYDIAPPPPGCRAAAALDAARPSQWREEQHAPGASLATVRRACQAVRRLLAARAPPAGLMATARLAAADSPARGAKIERQS
jgi:hypothetical protein